MAYAEIGLQPIGGQSKAGNAPQMWSYTAPGTDAIADINTEGYFNNASDVLKVGDLILFPNYLMHTAYPFVVDGERRSFSFNVELDKKVADVFHD